jgi:RHS repeat-associated protein
VAPDHLGAPHQITDSGGNVVWLWDHDPFGNGTPTGSFGYNLRFPGQFYDQQTGLHYNYFRDYDPAKGRYVESDPIGLAGGTNTYGYVGSNPLGRSDRLGLDPACDHLGKLLKDLSTLLIPIVDKINNIMEVADDVEKITEDIANTPPTVEGAHTVQGLNPETTNGHGSEGQASGPASAGNTGTTPDSFANING